MATKGYAGIKLYNMAMFKQKGVFILASSVNHSVLSWENFLRGSSLDELLELVEEKPYVYVEPEDVAIQGDADE